MQEPLKIPLPAGLTAAPPLLAMGSELKSSYCRLQGGIAQLSSSAGDLEQAEELHYYRQRIETALNEANFKPAAIAVDMHPDYLSTQLGERLADSLSLRLIPVQHHHAHIAACMAEHALPSGSRILGIALDGLGYGLSNQIWGGEFLLAGYDEFQRLGCFAPIGMPGGAAASREPWRNTLAHLNACGWDNIAAAFADTEIVRFLQGKPLPTLFAMLERGFNAPPASSAGRLFDAVAGALGIHRERMAFEAQAAIQLEKLAASAWEQETDAYPFELQPEEGPVRIGWRALWQALLGDLQQGVAPASIAARFHRGVVAAVATLAQQLCSDHALTTVALSGGVFQNRLLREGVVESLRSSGHRVLVPERVPAHDGGLAFGQACVAAAHLQ